MRLVHVELAQANAFVAEHHRHHQPVVGHRFSLGAEHAQQLVGVAIVGRPVARAVDHKHTVEVLRLCTNGHKNACSFLYSAAARAARELGYSQIQTYILDTESGVSLRAAGWAEAGKTKGGSWDTPARRREQKAPTNKKIKFVKVLRSNHD